MLFVVGVVIAAWIWWAWTPLEPLTSWSTPDDDTTLHSVSEDGTTLLTIASRTRRVRSSIFSDGLVGPVPALGSSSRAGTAQRLFPNLRS